MALESLSDKLNIEHDIPVRGTGFPVVREDPPVVSHAPTQFIELKDADEDYETTRKTLQGLLDSTTEAIRQMQAIAESSDEPRAYEVLGQLIKTQAATTAKLYSLHREAVELRKNNAQTPENRLKVENPTQINIDKAIFTGSSADLMSSISDIQAELANEKEQNGNN